MHFLNSSVVRTFTNTFFTSFSVFFPSGSTAIATEGLIQQKVIASNAAINILFIDNNTFMSNKIRKFKSKRYQLQCQIFSWEVFTSSVGKIASEVLLQGFHLLGRKDRFRSSLARLSPPQSGRYFQTFSGKVFTSSTGQIVFKPSHARFSPPRPERSLQKFSCKAFTSSTGSPMNLATVSGGMPSGWRLRTPDMALSSKRPIFANIIKIVELRLGLGGSDRCLSMNWAYFMDVEVRIGCLSMILAFFRLTCKVPCLSYLKIL